jgi:hypothetical protein
VAIKNRRKRGGELTMNEIDKINKNNYIILGVKGNVGREYKVYYTDDIVNEMTKYYNLKNDITYLKNVGIKIIDKGEVLLYKKEGNNIIILQIPASYKEKIEIKKSNIEPIIEFDLYNNRNGDAGIGSGAMYNISNGSKFEATIRITDRYDDIYIKKISFREVIKLNINK